MTYRNRRWSSRALAVLALTVLPLAPTLASAQNAARRPLVRIAPSMAWAMDGSSGVTAGNIRAEIPVGARLAPWVSWSGFQLGIACIPENPTCPADGTAWLAGMMLDGSGGPDARVRPYFGAGIGRWRNEEGTGFAHSALFGVSLELIPLLAPAAEVRWERFPVFDDQVLLSLGMQLTLPRPGGRAGR